jgi:hypothetical protein
MKKEAYICAILPVVVCHINIDICTTAIPLTTKHFISFVNIFSARISPIDLPQALKHMALKPIFGAFIFIYFNA